MSWEEFSESDLWDLINAGEKRMDAQQARLWEVIRIQPAKWAEKSYGEAGGGFLAVAILGNSVVWYNDIEEGFNRSKYSEHGEIGEYFCNQDDLEMTVQQIINILETGRDTTLRAGPPVAGVYAPEV